MRIFIWLIAGSIIVMIGVACNDSSTPTEATAAVVQNTQAPTQVMPSATPLPRNTLPPPATFAVETAPALPTRIAPPTITPQPSATSNLNLETDEQSANTSSDDDSPSPDEPNTDGGSDSITITFSNIAADMRNYDGFTPSNGGTILIDTLRVGFSQTLVELSVDIDLNGETQTLIMELTFEFRSDLGRVLINRLGAYEESTPADTYPDAILLLQLLEQAQTSLDRLISQGHQARTGDESLFTVEDFALGSNNIIVVTSSQGE